MRLLLACLALSSIALCIALPTLADTRAIYRCEVNGVPVFSDRPCAPAAVEVELDPTAMNSYEPPPASAARPTKKSREVSRRAEDPVATLQKRKETCERLGQRLRDIRSKMRAGYKASEGEKLKERQRRLSSQFRSARCS